MDGKLLCSYAEAGAQAAEHVVLLALLKPDTAQGNAATGSDAEDQEEEDGQEEDEDSETAQLDAAAAAFAFRQGKTPWYVPLQQARLQTGEWACCNKNAIGLHVL